MTWYVYIKPDGFPDILERKLGKNPLFSEWFLLETREGPKPDFGMQRYVNGKWVWGMSESENSVKRRSEMSPVMLMELLYEGMKAREIPKATKFFEYMDDLYRRYPK